jgi:tRNA uridine 5-carboxymethylaminomethyl modification enzyme
MEVDRDVIVIGGGHAGVEAAAAAARMGVRVVLVTLRAEGIGQMSCNPAIGGVGKGQLVKEVDALGGLMGRAIDATGIQFKLLNSSKGPAVQSSRAQADRFLYKSKIQQLLRALPSLEIKEAEVESIVAENGTVYGIKLACGEIIKAKSVVLTSGTFLRGLMHTGNTKTEGGRSGDCASFGISRSLNELGFQLGRLKTGTPPRLKRSSINFEILAEQAGDVPPRPFSITTNQITQPQISCYLTETNEIVHRLIEKNKQRSPMFNGQIQSGGPRYCPSIEDKVFRFAGKISHQVFLEPEGIESDIVYPNGISTSLPLDVQEEVVKNIRGLENCVIIEPGYAVEYDFVDPRGLTPALETKLIAGLFFAGQINGTSGYEEAAGQGLIAGVAAASRAQERSPLILSRGDAYIGVMIDDLITLGVDEPYRMFTSRAEYRLLLREDNAWQRLGAMAAEWDLLETEYQTVYKNRRASYASARKWLGDVKAKANSDTAAWLATFGGAPLKETIPLYELLRRPEVSIQAVLARFLEEDSLGLSSNEWVSIETEAKFEGYLGRQADEIERLKRSESQVIPADFSFDKVSSLRTEALEKFKMHRPHTIGQALRIPGITYSAVAQISLYLKRANCEQISSMSVHSEKA